MSLATNEDTSGWVTVGEDTFCPSCLRLARLEKRLLECQKAILAVHEEVKDV
jgi:hypothetical protein